MKQLILKAKGQQLTPKKHLKVYILRVSRQFSTEPSLFLFGGLCDTKKIIAVKKEADKAFRSGYDRVLLPWNFIFHPEIHKLTEWIILNPSRFILAVHKLSFKSFQKLFFKYKSARMCLELNLERYDNQFLQELENSGFFFYITIPAHKKMNLHKLSLQLNKRYRQNLEKITNRWKLLYQSCLNFYSNCFFHEGENFQTKPPNSNPIRIITKYKDFCLKKNSRSTIPFSNSSLTESVALFFKNKTLSVFIHFPCSHQPNPHLYNSKEIYDFLTTSYYPPPPYDIYNLSIPKDLKLEPENKPELVYNLTGPAFYRKNKKQPYWIQRLFKKSFSLNQLKASVIITAYNCERELALTLKHLYQQDLPKKEWELIVVDDGSQKKLSQFLKTQKPLQQMNFKFIFLPRDCPRTSSKDHRFRAGIARNLGAKYAQGQNLLFLDADILTPPHYISSVCQLLKTNDVVQHPRYHLIQSAPSNYKDINKVQHTFIKINDYWENFYATAENWNEKKLPWKIHFN